MKTFLILTALTIAISGKTAHAGSWELSQHRQNMVAMDTANSLQQMQLQQQMENDRMLQQQRMQLQRQQLAAPQHTHSAPALGATAFGGWR